MADRGGAVLAAVVIRDRWHELADACRDSNLTAADKAVFLYLLSRADYDTAELAARYTPTREVIQRKTSLSRTQVGYSTRHLERHGWLTAKGTTGPGKPLEYAFAVGCECDCTGRVHVPERCQPAAATVSTSDTERCQPTVSTPQVTLRAALRVNERKEVERRITEADVLTMTPARRCELCGADRDDAAGFIRHDPGCWHAQAMALYASES